MRVGPCVELNAIEGQAAIADGDRGESKPHLRIEAVGVHRQVGRGIPFADEAGQGDHCRGRVGNSS